MKINSKQHQCYVNFMDSIKHLPEEEREKRLNEAFEWALDIMTAQQLAQFGAMCVRTGANAGTLAKVDRRIAFLNSLQNK